MKTMITADWAKEKISWTTKHSETPDVKLLL